MRSVLGIALVLVILLVSGLITRLFARAMYRRCPACGTLNARRRRHCRSCQQSLAK